jgi:hypothetical protein
MTDPVQPQPVVKRGKIPTRKWIAAQVVALSGIAISAIDSGWDDTETKLLIGVAVQAALTYLLPNADSPTGVPDAKVLP